MSQISSSIVFEASSNTYIGLFWDINRPITAVAYHRLSNIMEGGALMKSFAGLVHVLVLWWLPDHL